MLDNLGPASIEVDIVLGKMCVVVAVCRTPSPQKTRRAESNHVVATTQHTCVSSKIAIPPRLTSLPCFPLPQNVPAIAGDNLTRCMTSCQKVSSDLGRFADIVM